MEHHLGRIYGCWRGGGITGKGAHILIVDDPIRTKEADSALVREKLWDWYQSTAYTRLAPGGGVLVIQTWWNDDDLAGRLQLAMALIGKGGRPEGIDDFEIIKLSGPQPVSTSTVTT